MRIAILGSALCDEGSFRQGMISHIEGEIEKFAANTGKRQAA